MSLAKIMNRSSCWAKRSALGFCRNISNQKKEDVVTHTGQKWDSDDYRMVRFMNAPKQVNNNWAVNLVAELPTKMVCEHTVWCDGGEGPEGHPRVYINLDKPGKHACGYCGQTFMYQKHH